MQDMTAADFENHSPAELRHALAAATNELEAMRGERKGPTSASMFATEYNGASAASASEVKTPTLDPAEVLLAQATKIVTGARRKSYGAPEDNFACIAGLWDAYWKRIRKLRGESAVLLPSDVAVMMVLVKCARLAETPAHADSWRDTAGYAACGARASNADLSVGAP